MAKVKNISQQQIASLGDAITFYYWKGKPYARLRKPKKGPRHSSRWEETKQWFKNCIKKWQDINFRVEEEWKREIKGTDWVARDAFVSYCIHEIFFPRKDPRVLTDLRHAIDKWEELRDLKVDLPARLQIYSAPRERFSTKRGSKRDKDTIKCRPPKRPKPTKCKRLYCSTLRTLRCRKKRGAWIREYEIKDFPFSYEEFWKRLREGFLKTKPRYENVPNQLAFYAEVSQPTPNRYWGKIVYSAIGFQTDFSRIPAGVSPDNITEAWVRLQSTATSLEPGEWVLWGEGEKHPLAPGLLEWGHLEKYFKDGVKSLMIEPYEHDPNILRPPKPEVGKTESKGHILEKPKVSIKYCYEQDIFIPCEWRYTREAAVACDVNLKDPDWCKKCWKKYLYSLPGGETYPPPYYIWFRGFLVLHEPHPLRLNSRSGFYYICPKDHMKRGKYYKCQNLFINLHLNVWDFSKAMWIRVSTMKEYKKDLNKVKMKHYFYQPPYKEGETNIEERWFGIQVPRKDIPYTGGYIWVLLYLDKPDCPTRERPHRVLQVMEKPRIYAHATGWNPSWFYITDPFSVYMIDSWDPTQGVIAPLITPRTADKLDAKTKNKKAFFIEIIPSEVVKHEKKEGVGEAENQNYDEAWEKAKEAFQRAEFKPTDEPPKVGIKTQVETESNGKVKAKISLNRVTTKLNLKDIPGNPGLKHLEACFLEYELDFSHDPVGYIYMPELDEAAPFELGPTYTANLTDHLGKMPSITFETELEELDEARPDDPEPEEAETRDSQIPLENFRARTLFIP